MQQPRSLRDIVYSSEIKMREKLSLKNLLADDPGLQRNYASQQSYRTSVRPHTSRQMPNVVYGERVRKHLNDESKKTKMQTQIKMRRQQSSYKVIKSSSGAELRVVTQQQKIRMKKALGIINVLADGSTLQYDEEEEIQAIFQFISCLAQVDNHYQTAFQYLLKRLKEIVFADPTNAIGRQIKKLADSSKNQQLIKFAYRNLGKITYGNLCKQLLKQTSNSVSKMQEAMKKQTTGEQKNLQIIKQKQELIKKLKRQLKYYQDHPSQDLYPYVKKLQREGKQMRQQIQQLLHLKNQNEYTIEIQQTSNLLLSQQIQSLKARIYQMELEELSGLKQIEKNSELKQFEENVDELKDMLEKSKLKMKGMKQQFEKVKAHNEQLINQRSLLAKRAAVGFGELTPRPNIKQIFNENNLIYQDYISLSKKNTSTQNITKSLVKKLKILEKTQTKETKQEIKKIEIQNESEDEEDQMQNTIDLIDQTKIQVNKAEQSAQQLKKSYSKQKQQKESIEKNMGKK